MNVMLGQCKMAEMVGMGRSVDRLIYSQRGQLGNGQRRQQVSSICFLRITFVCVNEEIAMLPKRNMGNRGLSVSYRTDTPSP